MSSKSHARVLYTCSRCCRFFENYDILLTHCYWKHGTDSQACQQCGLRTWETVLHRCDYLPGVYNNPNNQEIIDHSPSNSRQRDSLFCYCGEEKEGSFMIGCDNDHCSFKWFHFECVGIIVAPVGSWLCPECKVSINENKSQGVLKVHV